MTSIKITFIALLLFFGLLANAKETNKNDDYVILSSGERLEGRIQIPLNPNNFKKVRFKEANGKSMVLSPKDITEFKLSNGNKFKSAVHPKEGDKFFFQVIFDATPILMKYRGDLYIEHNSILRKLDLRVKKQNNNGVVRAESNKYVGVLKAIFGETCGPDFHQRIEETPPYVIDVKSLFEDFYQCKGVVYKALDKQEPHIVLSPVVGINFGSMSQSIQHIYSDEAVRTPINISPIDPSIGINALLDIHFQRDLPRVFLTTGVTYQSFKTQMNLLFNTSNTTSRYEEEYSVTNIGIPIIANYYIIGSENFKLHAGFGGQYRTSLKEELHAHGQREFYGFQRERLLRTEQVEPLRLNIMNNFGTLFKVGFTKKIANRFFFVGDFQVDRLNRVGVLEYKGDGIGQDKIYYSFQYYSINTAIKFK